MPGMIHTHNGLVLVDGSYYCFNRYHAIKRWWSFQPESREPDMKPSTSSVFVEKFRTTFIPALMAHRSKHAPNAGDIYVAKDGCEIWRYGHATDYKAGRDNSKHQDIGFFLVMAYRELYTDSSIKGILYHPNLEADDCIALAMRRLRAAAPAVPALIVTSDHDYMQLLDSRTKIVDMEDRDISCSKKCLGNPELDLFCKIICGDKSDNIKQVFPRVGLKTAAKLFANRDGLEKAFEKNNGSRERFEHNTLMIDFRRIPEELSTQLYATPAFSMLVEGVVQ